MQKVSVENTSGGTNCDGGVESCGVEKNKRFDRRTTGDSAVGFRDLLERAVVTGVLISP